MENHRKGWDHFIALCHETRDEKTLSMLLDLFLTAEERDDLATRYLIVKELITGEKTQRQIASDLNVSIAKITRGSNELKRTNNQIIKYLQQRFIK